MSQQKQTQKQLGELKKEIIRIQEGITRAKGLVDVLLGEVKEALPQAGEGSYQKDGSEEKDHYRVEKYPTEEEVIEGVFDGTQMIGHEGAPYPVPENYASKSKLVVGDRLKLTVTPQGRFVYKQIGPVPRETKRGVLIHKKDHDEYAVSVDGREYNVLKASVTFYKGEDGDEVIVVAPQGGEEVTWVAIDNIVKELPRFDGEARKTEDKVVRESTPPQRAPVGGGLEEI